MMNHEPIQSAALPEKEMHLFVPVYSQSRPTNLNVHGQALRLLGAASPTEGEVAPYCQCQKQSKNPEADAPAALREFLVKKKDAENPLLPVVDCRTKARSCHLGWLLEFV